MVDGSATFVVDGETVDVPQGTFLYVGADAQRKVPRFRDDARRDDDFAAVRDDPRFEAGLR